jgi:hypothetical protein
VKAKILDLFFCLALWVVPTAVLMAFHFAEARRRQQGGAKRRR